VLMRAQEERESHMLWREKRAEESYDGGESRFCIVIN
jgi:hypothetical protein